MGELPGAGGRASRPHSAVGKRRAGRDLKLVATEEGVRLRARHLILIAPRMSLSSPPRPWLWLRTPAKADGAAGMAGLLDGLGSLLLTRAVTARANIANDRRRARAGSRQRVAVGWLVALASDPMVPIQARQ